MARLGAQAVVSCPRSDIDHVVTEFGTAALRHKTIDERAEALIAIAAPEFRGELSAAWGKIRGLDRT